MNWKRTAIKAALSALLVLLIQEVYDSFEARIESPRPPPQSVALTCVTAGLPDLAVLCKAIPSPSKIQGGYIDFGDGLPHSMIGRTLTDSSEGKISSGKQLSVEQDTAEDGSDAVIRFYRKYKEPGAYRVNLVVIGEDGSYAGANHDVMVSRSEELEDDFRVTRVKVVAISEDAQEQPIEVPVAYRLSVHNLIYYEDRSYTVTVNPDPNWVLSRCEPFEESSSRFASRPKSPTLSLSREIGEFKFELESSPFFSGSKDGYLYGTIRCSQVPEHTVKSTQTESEFLVDQFGIIEIDLDAASNPMVVNAEAGNWELDIDGRTRPAHHWNQDYVYRQVRISLIDIPIIPPEVRRHKLYLRIERR